MLHAFVVCKHVVDFILDLAIWAFPSSILLGWFFERRSCGITARIQGNLQFFPVLFLEASQKFPMFVGSVVILYSIFALKPEHSLKLHSIFLVGSSYVFIELFYVLFCLYRNTCISLYDLCTIRQFNCSVVYITRSDIATLFFTRSLIFKYHYSYSSSMMIYFGVPPDQISKSYLSCPSS